MAAVKQKRIAGNPYYAVVGKTTGGGVRGIYVFSIRSDWFKNCLASRPDPGNCAAEFHSIQVLSVK
jgi:hypothetical protein